MKPVKSLLIKLFLILPASLLLQSCNSSEEPVINCAVSDLAVTVSAITNSGCGQSNGSVVVSGSGGSQPFTYSIDGVNFQSTATFDQLGSDSYTITIKDANGCTSTVEAIVEDESTLLVSATSTKSACQMTEGSITVTATGGTPTYMYKLNNASFQTANTFNNLAPGTYTITVMDLEGCEAIDSHKLLSTVGWAQDILPIINTRCALTGCHDGNSGVPNWTDLATVQQNAQRIKSRTAAKEMPPAGAQPLTDQQIALIGCWVDDGALNN